MSEASGERDDGTTPEALESTPTRRVVFGAIGAVTLLVALAALVFDLSIWSVAFGLLAALVGGRLLSISVRGVPLLEWDSEGLTDRTSLLGGDLFIPWDSVSSVSTGSLSAGIRLNYVADPHFTKPLDPGRRIQRWLNRFRGIHGLEIHPSFSADLDYHELGDSLDQIVTERQMREIRGASEPQELSAGREDSGDAEV